ncbi:long-chain-fatty-acid--CoA ligase [Nocardia asteroides]|uniref:long-chain-fatty-acid--CoA ligase n=1 Tax=Nocardia asteroides TaxID=1824 RepID=UPI00343F9EC5
MRWPLGRRGDLRWIRPDRRGAHRGSAVTQSLSRNAMKHTMQDVPLTVDQLFRRAERYSAHRTITEARHDMFVETSMRDWAHRTRRLAGALAGMALPIGTAVATFAANTIRHVELSFAVPGSGLVLHPINVRLPADQLTYILDHAQDAVVFVDRSLVERLIPVLANTPSVRRIVIMDDGGEPAGADFASSSPVPVDDYEDLLASAEPVDLHVGDETLPATICYTSGTTGNPKAVVNSHRTLWLHTMSLLQTDTAGICERDTVLPLVPIFHAGAWGLCYAALTAGADLVLPGPDLSGPAIARVIVQRRVSFATAVPTVWTRVLPELRERDTSAVRMFCAGGSAVPVRLSELCREVTGRPLVQVWGMTETNAFAAMTRVRAHLDPTDLAVVQAVSHTQGIASPGVEFRIVSEDSGRELEWDGAAVGELQCRGPWVTARYHGDTEPHASTADGWFRTGDTAVIDPDGYIRLRDRLKDLIKSGGEWISSLELEVAIQRYPGVESVAVIGVPSERWDERPIACVVPAAGGSVEPHELLSWLGSQVAKFCVPDEVHLLADLPMTSVGKIDKKALRALYAAEMRR